jgi:hypothetical protein
MTIVSALIIEMYWGLSMKDAVGASNIASCIVALGMLLGAVIYAIPIGIAGTATAIPK